ncbi:ABC transporter ATP-binding protein [Flaviflagellibacter deserti]|uniref:ABC transporter ATP-binding protein n=1 Tax=Flaviflagellibacter deserti TaxID=2267266 RepID=A0ABV9YXB7_9HYPH
MPLLRLSSLSKRFPNGVSALDDFDLSIEREDVVTLIGPSGCGKSTVLRLIAGLDEPSSGHVAWSGARPEIGFVFQEPTLMPWASAFANVWLPLRLRGVSRAHARERIEQALELVGLEDFAEARPDQLSGGMKMRVSLARALVSKPEVLLLDEPFAALDEMTRFRLNDELLAIRERLRCTIVFVTHSVFEAVYLSNRIVVMSTRPGRVVEDIGVAEQYPRSEAFRTSVSYAETARQISKALRGDSGLDKQAVQVHS